MFPPFFWLLLPPALSRRPLCRSFSECSHRQRSQQFFCNKLTLLSFNTLLSASLSSPLGCPQTLRCRHCRLLKRSPCSLWQKSFPYYPLNSPLHTSIPRKRREPHIFSLYPYVNILSDHVLYFFFFKTILLLTLYTLKLLCQEIRHSVKIGELFAILPYLRT